MSVYKKHLILLHVSQHGRPNKSFLSWQISTQVAVATWLLLEVLPVLMYITVVSLYVYGLVREKALFNSIVRERRFEPGTEEKYEANPL
jgi:hypothetical protein